ncbi:hypothetical protein [Haloimpatiens massiliensis]|uniref:hypothetical protein n=1 Tax=Haloimpatiens massiliensis TaxID=1658110 RepID=UPI0015E09278|nr:hypothetical protein [Haloimpatiens massiliensis]
MKKVDFDYKIIYWALDIDQDYKKLCMKIDKFIYVKDFLTLVDGNHPLFLFL